MIKILFIILLAIIFSSGYVWLIDHEGTIAIQWLDLYIELDTTLLIFGIIVFIFSIILLTDIIRFCIKFPKKMHNRMQHEKQKNALNALVDGFICMLNGDIKKTIKLAHKSYANKDVRPLSLLLLAQSAQAEKNTQLARSYFQEMMNDNKTKPLALKAMSNIEKNEGNLLKAIEFAEQSTTFKDSKQDSILNLQELYIKTKQWDKLKENTKKAFYNKILDKKSYERLMTVIDIVKSKEILHRDIDLALLSAKNAYNNSSNYIPAIVNYVSCLAHKNRYDKAIKILEKSYKSNQHPDLIYQYSNLLEHIPLNKKLFNLSFKRQIGDIHLEKLEKLYNSSTKNYGCLLAIADIAKDKCNFDMSYNYLKKALKLDETANLYHMMAEIELHYHNEEGYKSCQNKAKDAKECCKWRCSKCYYSSNDWHAFCNNCNSFNSLEFV